MSTVAAHGIEARLPDGFEAHVFKRVPTGPGQCYPVAQFSTFPLPVGAGDFGGGATTLMGPTDVFVVLFEYGPESVGTKLFARQGMPRVLSESDFRPELLRRGLPGQAGTQWFFVEQGRPFTLYVVLGDFAMRTLLVPRVNDLLTSVRIAAAATSSTRTVPQWN
jgi:hypothetical protein